MYRNDLSKFEEIKLYFSYSLFVLFLITSYALPYPQSLYWFIFLSVILTGGLLSSKLVRQEIKRQLGLPRKELITNVLFYSLMMVTFFQFF